MKLNFDWSNFDEKTFYNVVDKKDTLDNWVGNVRVGDLCFDILLNEYSNDNGVFLDYDLYVGGIDTGYGYSYRYDNKEYPYDYADGGSFNEKWFEMNYAEFVEYAEKTMTEFILEANTNWYDKADLIAKATEELNLW